MRLKKKIIFHLLGSDLDLTGFLFDSPGDLILRSSPDEIVKDSWELPSEGQILVRIALDIWNGSGNVFLSEVLQDLKPSAMARVISALAGARSLQIADDKFENIEVRK